MDSIANSEKNKEIIRESMKELVQLFSDLEDTKADINDVIKTAAEKLEIKPATLRTAARLYIKKQLAEKVEETSTIQEIIAAATSK